MSNLIKSFDCLLHTSVVILQCQLNIRTSNMYSIIFAAILCFSYFANGFPITDCGSKVGNFSKITISGCDSTASRCILRKGKNATIEIDFTIDVDATDLKSVVHGTVFVVPVPFHLPQPDACDDPQSGITCPLTKNTTHHYTTTLPVRSSYPSVAVTVKWELQDENGDDVVCLTLPAKIQ